MTAECTAEEDTPSKFNVTEVVKDSFKSSYTSVFDSPSSSPK